MERYYRFAGLEFLVSIPAEIMYENEHRLAPFSVTAVKDPHIFTLEKRETLPEPRGVLLARQPNFCAYEEKDMLVRYVGPESEPYLRAEHRGKEHRIFLRAGEYKNRLGTKAVLESMAAEHLIAQNHGFIFHCAYIEREGRAILFTAPSGTGKSTQADLWAEHRGAEIINGDRAAVRLVDGVILAEGIPFCGSSEYCRNRSLPIAAIVYLSQAPETTIRKMRGYEAFSKIWEGVSVNTWDKTDMENVTAVVETVAKTVPMYHLACTPDESAVIALETVLRKQAAI